jgi:uncharacterized LabA/DUF88 family protein
MISMIEKTISAWENNIAFIDWQNLHLWTLSENWTIDFSKFRTYLREKYKIHEAFYFLWFISSQEQELYDRLIRSWFIVIFREHSTHLKWKKKWNVDVDIVFEIMRNIIDRRDFDKIVLVSWDWDYIKLVKYLIQKNILKKILFPNRTYSSLYKSIKDHYWLNLSLNEIRWKIQYKKREPF